MTSRPSVFGLLGEEQGHMSSGAEVAMRLGPEGYCCLVERIAHVAQSVGMAMVVLVLEPVGSLWHRRVETVTDRSIGNPLRCPQFPTLLEVVPLASSQLGPTSLCRVTKAWVATEQMEHELPWCHRDSVDRPRRQTNHRHWGARPAREWCWESTGELTVSC